MHNNNDDSSMYNIDTMQAMLFNRLKNLYLEEDEPYFMINYKPQPHTKCFLTTDDINKHVHNGCLIFPQTFCKKLRALAEPIQRDQQQIELILGTFVEKLRKQMIELVDTFSENIKSKLLPNTDPYDFLMNFFKGNFKEDEKLLHALEELIRKWEIFENNFTLNLIDNKLQNIESKFKEAIKEAETSLNGVADSLDANKKGIQEAKQKALGNIVEMYAIPKSFEQLDQVIIHKGKPIPWINGIDIHPHKNIYIAMGCHNGDLVIRNQDTNKEVNRVNLNNNSDGSCQNCLWSPSGSKIMVTTYENHSIYIYDETGEKLLKSMEKTHSSNGYGATWLSEIEIAVGYDDGVVKFFNSDEKKRIGSVKLSGNYALGMEAFDDSHLLVGDDSGSITNIDWRNNKIEWVKNGWHFDSNCISCLKLNKNKTRLLTGSEDQFVKLMALQDQSKLWEFKMSYFVNGISWVPGELYVLVLNEASQLAALNAKDGSKIIEFNELSSASATLRLNPATAEVFIGDSNGTVRRLKICHF